MMGETGTWGDDRKLGRAVLCKVQTSPGKATIVK